MAKIQILNLYLDNFTQEELLKKLEVGGAVFTPNVDHLIQLQRDKDFFSVYNAADYRVCDSKILMYASRFLGSPLKEKISGSDFFPAFYNYNKNNPKVKIFLLGAARGVARRAKEKINFKVGREMVVGTYSPPRGFENDAYECQKIVHMINQSGATVLAVGLGAPKQEKFIFKIKEQLTNVKVFLAIGATIDFEAGCIKRSPKWMSEIGLEWLYRLLTEPQRLWKRYLVDNPPIFWLLLKQKLRLYKNPFGEMHRAFSTPSFYSYSLDQSAEQPGIQTSYLQETVGKV